MKRSRYLDAREAVAFCGGRGVDRIVLTQDEWCAAAKRGHRRGCWFSCEQYVVEYDKPGDDGYYGRRLSAIFEVVGDEDKASHDLVERRFRELHPQAVNVRVVYA